MKITVAIALYNEEENVGPLTTRLTTTLNSMEGCAWQLIYMIEGTDRTLSIAQSFASQCPGIQILYNETPSGLGSAFRRCFAAISPDTDVVITMDADLNHQPEEIPRLVKALVDRNADLVVGSRKMAGSEVEGAPLWKTSLSDTVNKIMRKMTGVPVRDQTSGYRIYRYPVLLKLPFKNDGFAFLPEIIMSAHNQNFRVVEEPIQFIFRTLGESKMKLLPTARSYLALLFSRLTRK